MRFADWVAIYEERAGVREFDAGMKRSAAQNAALMDLRQMIDDQFGDAIDEQTRQAILAHHRMCMA